MRRTTAIVWAVVLVTALGTAAAVLRGDGAAARDRPAYPEDGRLRVNDLQVIGTHNSYHLRPSTPILGGSVDFAHAPLDVQLEEQRVRSVELDAYNGPDFPVEHSPVLDAATSCTPLAVCLGIVERWSDEHPGHVPIFVLLEPKEQTVPLDRSIHDWDRAALDQVDQIIRSTIGDNDLLSPDEVRRSARTLRNAVTRRGWPTLRRTRGTIAVVLNDSGAIRRSYLAGRPTLEGAAMFVTADPSAPSAAVVKRDDPNRADIKALVEAGFVVRTRADADLVEARVGDHRRAATALESGAHIVSTDFPVVDRRVSNYRVRLTRGRTVRCNPVSAPARCRSRDLENARGLRARR